MTCVYDEVRHSWDFGSLPCLAHLNNPIESSSITKPLLRVGTAMLVFSRYSKGNPMQVSLMMYYNAVAQYCASAHLMVISVGESPSEAAEPDLSVGAGTYLRPVSERFLFFGQVRKELQQGILILEIEVRFWKESGF